MDCTGGYLDAGDVDGIYSGHGGGYGREVVRGGIYGDNNMSELPVPEPMYGVQPNDAVPVVQKMDPRRVEPSKVQVTKKYLQP